MDNRLRRANNGSGGGPFSSKQRATLFVCPSELIMAVASGMLMQEEVLNELALQKVLQPAGQLYVHVDVAVSVAVPGFNRFHNAVRQEVVPFEQSSELIEAQVTVSVGVVKLEVLQGSLLVEVVITVRLRCLAELLEINPAAAVCVEDRKLVVPLDGEDALVGLRMQERMELRDGELAICISVSGMESALLMHRLVPAAVEG
mmetsp:Transcript_29924/g.76154  ORF Transcript_29924/g.76154 Transcript_29924/m.76154 type:complete len:202 (+) Transcript_29924:83-688(+)